MRKYGAPVIGGNSTRPNISIGTRPSSSDRSSSVCCTKRDRFATTRIVSSSSRRRNARTFRFSGWRNSSEPRDERPVAPAQVDQPLHPPQQRVRVGLLDLDVDRLVVVLGVGDHRQVQLLAVRRREAGVAVAAPLHRRAHAVAVAEVDVVAHPDLVAVVDDRRARQRHEQPVHQLDAPPVVAEQRGEPPADPEVDPHLRIARVDAVHVVALLVGHHLERQLVVVAQEQRPLGVLRDRRRLLEDVDDREAVLHPDRHEHPRHDREVEGHVAFVAVAEVRDRVLRPLVRLGEQHPVRRSRSSMCARSCLRNAWVSGRFSQLVPSRS